MDTIYNLLIAYTVAFIGAASPGPATLAIMSTSATYGRAAGLRLGLGIANGSVIWGLFAAFGMIALLAQFSWALTLIKTIGGVYLLWLASKALRIALTPDKGVQALKVTPKGLYWQGLALHLTNPKAMLSWSAIIAIGAPAGASAGYLMALFAGVALITFGTFIGYALLFSTPRMMSGYQRLRRKINGALAAVFGFAGVKLLTSNT